MDKSTLVIRLMSMSDLSQVLKIEKEVYQDPWREEVFYHEIQLKSSYVLEDKETDSIVGYLCGLQIIDEYHLFNIAVSSHHWNKGYGSMMLEHLVVNSFQRGCRFISLEVRESNFKAIGLYQKYGFQFIGRRKGYYQTPVEDALVMRLELTSDKE